MDNRRIPFPRAVAVAVLVFGVRAAGAVSNSEGIVDGKPAIYVAARNAAGGESVLEGCTAHVLRADDLSDEKEIPCQQWFAPDRGRYVVWLESPSQISTTQSVIVSGGGPAKGGGPRLLFQVTDSAAVIVPAGLPAGTTLRTITFSAAMAFQRRVPIPTAGTSVRVPAGTSIVGIFRNDSDAVGVAGPLVLQAGERYELPSHHPQAQTATVFFVIDRQSTQRGILESLELRDERGTVAPVLLRDGGRSIYALWNDVPPGKYAVRATGGDLVASERPIEATAGSVIVVRTQLRAPSR